MTLFHQKASKPGRKFGSKPSKLHPWKMGISRRRMLIKGENSKTEMEHSFEMPDTMRNLAG